MSELSGSYRTHYCGEITKDTVHQTVKVAGWVHTKRDMGGVLFIDLRDRSGLVQVVFREEVNAEVLEQAKHLHYETVVAVTGTVEFRPPDTINPKLPNGDVEIVAQTLSVLNPADPLPFTIQEAHKASEITRLTYRFLDLRRPEMWRNFFIRHRVILGIRNFLHKHGFVEVETPILTRSTPEGARDFLVPSRLHPGKFYALPQSPQLFKQLLMVSGFDRYFQIARCFRDEDLRADRQPEFTQVDIEMSFVTEDDVMSLTEDLLQEMFEEIGVTLSPPFPRIPFKEALERYGSDKPDLRYPLELMRVDDMFTSSEFRILGDAAREPSRCVMSIGVKGGASWTRNRLDQLTEYMKSLGSPGLFWIKFEKNGDIKSPIKKFLTSTELSRLKEKLDLREGDLVLMLAGVWEETCLLAGKLRERVIQLLELQPTQDWSFCWIIQFPLLEWSEEENRWVARHHPFTSPDPETLNFYPNHPEKIRARAYDIVLNGVEIGGGSIRNHTVEQQETVFKILGIPREEYEEKFSFLLNALRYGAPPHGGIALGLDRIIMMMVGAPSIRDVIAFPKTASGLCPLTGSPSQVSNEQLKILNIRVIPS